MVQEVQTWIGIANETTLETIEAIGTSSFKIKEGRQTTGRYVSKCSGSAYVQRGYTGGTRDSGLVKGSVTLANSDWLAEFIQTNGGIRIPKAGTYEITYASWQAGGVSYDSNFYLKNWPNPTDKNIYSYSAVGYYYALNGSFIVDLGKFDIITCWATFNYTGSASGATLADWINTLTIKQL